MKVLVACEYSGEVRRRLDALGHEVMSCDLLPADDGATNHFQGDVREILCNGWDMVIAFPPCTHLACSGAKHFAKKQADGRQQEGIDFFMLFTRLNMVEKVAIENPVGIMSNYYREPDQIIQPYYFGDPFQKTTCLWLKGLKPLQHNAEPDLFGTPVTHTHRGEFVTTPSGKTLPKWYSDNKSAKARSKTFPGIADAMATQWGRI